MNNWTHHSYGLGYTVSKSDFLPLRVCEPRPRMCEGHYQYVFHRFPIIGGISVLEGLLGNCKLTQEKIFRDVLFKSGEQNENAKE